ncbi:EexN family lipoprotein [Kosakonia sp. BK9b]|uniref:EexN family lipoprotein n=1 Tax=Kosakonia sp. TaxID=1916651 RepID=UPI0028964148|nr:EexN family lipoprotein [Kosakonia sp.]
MRTELLSIGLLAAALLSGCDANAQSIEWYKTHDKERNAKVEECKKASNPRGTEDCRNAIDASVRSGAYTRSPAKSW